MPQAGPFSRLPLCQPSLSRIQDGLTGHPALQNSPGTSDKALVFLELQFLQLALMLKKNTYSWHLLRQTFRGDTAIGVRPLPWGPAGRQR